MNQSLKIFILGAFLMRFVLTESHCKYMNASSPYDEEMVYSCLLNISSPLVTISGSHLNGYCDERVFNLIRWIGLSREFPKIVCEKFKYLRHVSVREAGIEIIRSKDLRLCKSLRDLWMSENQIRELPENLFLKNANLRSLYLDNNQIVNLSANIFKNLRKLEILSLQGNNGIQLLSNIFDPLVNLAELYLHNVGLNFVDPRWFDRLDKLETLRLDNNEITQLSALTFSNLSYLRVLQMHRNKLKVLSSNVFPSVLDSLEIFSINFNNLAAIDRRVFDILNAVSTVEIAENDCIDKNFNFFQTNKLYKLRLFEECFRNYDEKLL